MRVDNLRFKVIALIGFTLVCVLAFVYLFQQAGGRLRFGKPYTVSTLVPDALNIVNNSDVRMDGITIGRVRKLDDVGADAKLTFEIEDKDHDTLYKDAKVRVRTKTLVGESYLDITPGTPKAGLLPDGSTLPVDNADEVVPLERILNSLDKPTRTQIQRNLKGIGVGLDGHGGDLNDLWGSAQSTVADGGKLMRVLQPQKQDLAALIEQTGVVTEALGEREQAMRSLAVDAKRTAESVVSRDDQLRQTIRSLPGLLDRAQSSVATLSTFSTKATPVVRDLRRSATNLTPAVQDLGPVARDTRTLFNELEPFLDRFDPVLRQLRPGADKLRTVVGPLDAFLRQANPTLNYFKDYKNEFGTFFSNVGSLVGVKDAYGYKGRVFGMVGENQVTNLNDDARQLLDQLVDAGGLGEAHSTRRNPLPKPGSAGDPQLGDGSYTTVDADK